LRKAETAEQKGHCTGEPDTGCHLAQVVLGELETAI
jgi:hypothetical protein